MRKLLQKSYLLEIKNGLISRWCETKLIYQFALHLMLRRTPYPRRPVHASSAGSIAFIDSFLINAIHEVYLTSFSNSFL